jgi:LPXTG-site transpeptidase (sortase) family protein
MLAGGRCPASVAAPEQRDALEVAHQVRARDVPIRVGFDQRTLALGPGWLPGSRLPGEGRLVYIAGHHRTHGAPFRYVADLDRGDTVEITTPYATATYTITRRTTVPQTDFAVLRSPAHELLRLQTSTVPAGSRRIIVTARLVTLRARTGREP